MTQAPDATALSTSAYSPDAADHIFDYDAVHRQYVSDGLAAQTLTGNVKAQLQCLEAHASNNLQLAIKVLVISNDGTTALSTLLAIARGGTEPTTALTNRTYPSVAMGSYACADGDRLCVEIGLGGLPTSGSGTNSHNGSIRWGGSAAGGDLPIDDTDTGTTLRPWIEFANTFTFQPLTSRGIPFGGAGTAFGGGRPLTGIIR